MKSEAKHEASEGAVVGIHRDQVLAHTAITRTRILPLRTPRFLILSLESGGCMSKSGC